MSDKSKKGLRINTQISSEKIRLIDSEGNQLGVVNLLDGLKKADDVGLDLVEISPATNPPVCKILDYGKYLYEKQKLDKRNKKKQHVIKVKEIRLRPRIEDHDLMTKLNMGKKFLSDGCKLKITLIFRGRELSRIDLGKDVMDRVIQELAEIADIEKDIPLEGRRMSVIMTAK